MESTTNLASESTLNIQEKTEQKDVFKELPFRKKIQYIINVITVEPLLCCYVMPSILFSLATQNMSLELGCRVNLNYDAEFCSQLLSRNSSISFAEVETKVQKIITNMLIWKTTIQCAIPAILILFLGSYSDRHKCRKPFLIMPLIGETISVIAFILCAINRSKWPLEAVGVSESVFPAITGGYTTMMMAIYSYVSDVSSIEMRTLRIGIVHLTITVLAPIGASLSGVLFKAIGYYGLYSIALVSYCVGFWYAIFILKEPKQSIVTKKNFCADLFDPKHIKSTFSIIVKKREGSKRIRIILLMVVFIVIIGPTYGEASVAYLFTRTRFGWDEVNFSFYTTYDIIIHLIGTTFAISVLSQMLKIDDLLIAALACTCKVAASFFYAFGTTTLFYIAPIISIMNGAGSIVMRSIATKIVSPDELGKIQSLFGICEGVAPIIYSTIYSQVYSATIETLPGAFFLLGAVLISPSIFIFLSMYFLQKREKNLSDKKENKIPENNLGYTESERL